ncbi:unnamed protein product, partial [Brassica rapa subsp. trilocularis]
LLERKKGRRLLGKRKGLGTIETRRTKKSRKMEGTLERHSLLQFGQLSKLSFDNRPPSNAAESSELRNELGADGDWGEKEFILSQDFFCTPDYITPDNQNLMSDLNISMDHSPCPRSPVKLTSAKSKRCRQDSFTFNTSDSTWASKYRVDEQEDDDIDIDEIMVDKTERTGYVSRSAVALRSRVMPPPCLKNPYVMNESDTATDPFGYQRSKCASFLPASMGGDGLSRYLTDFHEIQQIGAGNFSRVFKVLKRIDGCLYAVKHSTRKLYLDSERCKAMMEVQALAALGFHENVVGYYNSWFENEQLYIQLELCDHSLSKKSSLRISEREILVIMHQIAKALQFVHEKGIAHLDVKPDNIYIKNGVCKLGDFGCATRLDKSLPVEEGDARYMPQEVLNENYEHLDKVDIFSLGVTVYELIRGSPLTESRNKSLNIKQGKLPLLPGHSLQLQQLLKTMMDRDPCRRPSARELMEHPMFDRIRVQMESHSDGESSEMVGDWDFLPPPVKGTRVSENDRGGGGGRVLPPWADPSYEWGGGKWKVDGRKNRKNKKKEKESDLSVEDVMKEYSSLPPQIAEWYWCIEYVAKYVKDLRCILDVMNMGFPTTNDYGSRINEILSLRILESFFDPAAAAAATVVVGPRIEFDLSLSSTHVLNAILQHVTVSELRPGMPELSNFNLLPFFAHKNMSLPPCALEVLRDVSAMEDQTSAAPTMEANDPVFRDDRSEHRRYVCEEMAIDEEQVHTGFEQTNMKDKDEVVVIDHEDSPPVQRDEVIVIDGNVVIDGDDTTAEKLLNKGNTTRETSSPGLDVRVKCTKDGAWLISESDRDPPSSRPENVCWKCERVGGASLLICSRSECAAKVHKECLNCPAHFDEDDNFHCPMCWYDRVTMEYRESQKLMSCAKRRLVKFLPLLSRASKRLR